MKYFTKPNLTAIGVTELDRHPTEVENNADYSLPKTEFNEWCRLPTTDHCFLSTIEGSNAGLGVGKENAPVFLHGLIVDYDAVVEDNEINTIPNRAITEYLPNYIYRTRSGTGVRLVWEFPQPVPVAGWQYTKAFLTTLHAKLGLSKLLPGLDKQAYLRATQYYELGRTWEKQERSPTIPYSTLSYWLAQATERFNFVKHLDSIRIPMDIIADEVERQFPGRWSGPFEEGAQGVRFWDRDADNERGCIVRDGGVQCFTGPKAFVAWSEIFGAAFVTKQESDRIGAATQNLYYDGLHYWQQLADGRWKSWVVGDIKLRLNVEFGLQKKNEDGRPSEIDRAIFHVQTHNSVDSALPMVHQTPDVSMVMGKRVLNTSTTAVLPPSEKGSATEWGDGFPWLSGFLDSFFDEAGHFPEHPLKYFLAWLQRWYGSALHNHMTQGHAIFIAGDPGVGKTLLSNLVLSTLMGGHVDCGPYLLGEDSFNGELFHSALWTIDDQTPNADDRTHKKYSANIKKAVANRTIRRNEKFERAGMTKWFGRTVVTCNTDLESLRVIPDPEATLLDKVMFFKARKHEVQFPLDMDDVVYRELPYFARWLLSWKAPATIVGTDRFGIKSYHHPQIIEQLQGTSHAASAEEVIDLWRKSYFQPDTEAEWEGTAAELLSEMQQDGVTEGLVKSYTPQSIGRALRHLQTTGCRGLEYKRASGKRLWVVKS